MQTSDKHFGNYFYWATKLLTIYTKTPTKDQLKQGCQVNELCSPFFSQIEKSSSELHQILCLLLAEFTKAAVVFVEAQICIIFCTFFFSVVLAAVALELGNASWFSWVFITALVVSTLTTAAFISWCRKQKITIWKCRHFYLHYIHMYKWIQLLVYGHM